MMLSSSTWFRVVQHVVRNSTWHSRDGSVCVQSNLKFARQLATPFTFPVVDFRGADLHKQLERAALQRVLEHFQAFGACSNFGVATQALNSPYTKVSSTEATALINCIF
jgi:hypothetical protein